MSVVLARYKPLALTAAPRAPVVKRHSETREAMMSRSGWKASKVAGGAFIIPSQQHYKTERAEQCTERETDGEMTPSTEAAQDLYPLRILLISPTHPTHAHTYTRRGNATPAWTNRSHSIRKLK